MLCCAPRTGIGTGRPRHGEPALRLGHSTRRRIWLERISLVALDGAAFAAGLRMAHDLYLGLAPLSPASKMCIRDRLVELNA